MRNSKNLSATAAAAELVPQDYLAQLDLSGIFAKPAPVEIDIGCGDGSFLTALAADHPGRNFLGIERLPGRVRGVCRKIALRNLENARVLRVESAYAVRYLLPPESIAAFHLMFPDPWPKRRHQGRRIANEEFLRAIYRALAPGAFLHVATDQRAYFGEINESVKHVEGWTTDDSSRDFPMSTFEKQFRVNGLEIHRLVLRKVSDVR